MPSRLSSAIPLVPSQPRIDKNHRLPSKPNCSHKNPQPETLHPKPSQVELRIKGQRPSATTAHPSSSGGSPAGSPAPPATALVAVDFPRDLNFEARVKRYDTVEAALFDAPHLAGRSLSDFRRTASAALRISGMLKERPFLTYPPSQQRLDNFLSFLRGSLNSPPPYV